MKEAKEKWVPCTSTFPDYEICVGPVISIRRVKTAQGSYKGKTIAIQLYRGQFWATLYNRFGKATRVNILDMAKWSSAAEWKREHGTTEETEPAPTINTWRQQIAERQKTAAPNPTPAPPPPTAKEIRGWMLEIQGDPNMLDSVKFRKLAEFKKMLTDLTAKELADLAPAGEQKI